MPTPEPLIVTLTLADAWVNDLDPVLLPIAGPLAIRWYGLAYLGGFAIAFLILKFLAKRGALRIPPNTAFDALVTLVIGVLVGGRVGYALFYDPTLFGFSADPPFWRLLALNQGGMASHGGMIGVAAALFIIARRSGAPFLNIADAATIAAAPGLLLGRLANFVNGELLGRIVADPGEPAPWFAVRFPTELANRPAELAARLSNEQLDRLNALLAPIAQQLEARLGAPPSDRAVFAAAVERVRAGDEQFTQQLGELLTSRHPSQLYQAFAEGLLVFVVLAIVSAKPRRAGTTSAAFLITYGIGRIATEFYRLPDVGVATTLGLSRGQLLSSVMIAGGVALLIFVRRANTPVMGGWLRPTEPAPDTPKNSNAPGGDAKAPADRGQATPPTDSD